MEAQQFINMLESVLGVDAYFGVPDSLLRPFVDELAERYGFGGPNHVIAADEGGAAALAAGHYLATGSPAVVYMQNSGIGNAVNPICSLLHEDVYAIPALFIVGWRGEPGVHDEPQHVFQGRCSKELLESIGLSVEIISEDTTQEQLASILAKVNKRFSKGQSAALLVRKGALKNKDKRTYSHEGKLTREVAVATTVEALPNDTAIVSTTGKLSRELFEIREQLGQTHERDFLTVGSMGHSSMIGLGIALAQPHRLVVVLDGDGACLMHTGAFAVLAKEQPNNLIHILFNNEAHESVGGMPTASTIINWPELAKSCGYSSAVSVDCIDDLINAINYALAKQEGPFFIEIKTDLSSRADLGRPTTSAYENGIAFRSFLQD